jgi:hypothetical protein
MAGLVPAIPLKLALCAPNRDARHKAGHDTGHSHQLDAGDVIVERLARRDCAVPTV